MATVVTPSQSTASEPIDGPFIIAIRDTAYAREAVENTILYMAKHHYGLFPLGMEFFRPFYGPLKAAPTTIATTRVNTAANVGRGGQVYGVLIVPPVEEPEWQTSSPGSAQPILFSPRPTSFSRRGGEFRLSITTRPDTVLTPQGMGGVSLPQGWITRYLTLLEALATPVSVLGRKPWLGVKVGGTWVGASGNFAMQLESIQVRVEWMGDDIHSAQVSLEFGEYLMF